MVVYLCSLAEGQARPAHTTLAAPGRPLHFFFFYFSPYFSQISRAWSHRKCGKLGEYSLGDFGVFVSLDHLFPHQDLGKFSLNPWLILQFIPKIPIFLVE